MTSSGPIEVVARGNLPEEHLFQNKEVELLRVQCTICLNLNRHLVLGSFQKVKIQTDGIRHLWGVEPQQWSCTRTAIMEIRSADPRRGQELGVSPKDCVKLLCFSQHQQVKGVGDLSKVLVSVCVSWSGAAKLYTDDRL